MHTHTHLHVCYHMLTFHRGTIHTHTASLARTHICYLMWTFHLGTIHMHTHICSLMFTFLMGTIEIHIHTHTYRYYIFSTNSPVCAHRVLTCGYIPVAVLSLQVHGNRNRKR